MPRTRTQFHWNFSGVRNALVGTRREVAGLGQKATRLATGIRELRDRLDQINATVDKLRPRPPRRKRP